MKNEKDKLNDIYGKIRYDSPDFFDNKFFDNIKPVYNDLINDYEAIYNNYVSENIAGSLPNNTLTAEMVNNMVKKYRNSVYDVDYINTIIYQLDGLMESFSVSKKIFLPSGKHEYLICINNILVIKVNKSDPFTIEGIYMSEKPIVYLERMTAEASEKISSKYMQYISRLEDDLGKPFLEILELGLT